MSYTYITAVTGNIVSFVAATTLSWTSPVLPQLEDNDATPFEKALTSDQTSWISGLLPLGAAFGPFIFGYLADKLGRKWSLIICDIPFIIAFFMLAFAKNAVLYYIARFITGLAVGGVFTLIPMYIGEISQDSNRGALGALMNTFICFGILFSYAVGPYVSIMIFNLILAMFPSIFLILFFFIGPESPHFYISKNQHDLAKTALRKIRGTANESIEKELLEIQEKIREEGHGTFLDIFKSKGTIKALIISSCLLGFQQFSGINAVLFYAQDIFKQAGTSLNSAICSIIIGAVEVATSFVAPILVDRLGRKILLIMSAIGMFVSEAPLGVYSYLRSHDHDVSSISFLPILCLIGYIATYNSGFGPIPWALMGELFPTNVKSVASSSVTAFCWFLGFLIAKYFAAISDAIGMGPSFWIFAICCAISIPFVFFYVIETKGKSLQEIQTDLNR